MKLVNDIDDFKRFIISAAHFKQYLTYKLTIAYFKLK